MAKNLLPSSNFVRGQRNIPTEPDKTAYDPDFGKPRPDPNKTAADPNFGKSKPTDIKPPGSEKTQIKPKPGSAQAPTEKMTRLPDSLEEQPARTDLEEIEKAARGEEPPTRRMPKPTAKKGEAPRPSSGEKTKIAPKGPPEPMQPADLQKELEEAKRAKPGKPGKAPDLKKLPPGKTLPQGAPGLAEYEKTKKPAKPAKPSAAQSAPTKIKPKPGKGIGFGAKARSVLKSVGKVVAVGAVASVIGFAILDHLGVAIFEHAADIVLEKMGPETDLSDYLPDGANANKVIWSEASYTRHSRENVGDDSLPNVLVDNITIYPPRNGILVMGISVEGLPDFVGDINVNELGDGNSDWLCEKYGGYLICRSMSKAYPLNAKLKTALTFQYHLPAYELKQLLAIGGGSRAVYFIVKP